MSTPHTSCRKGKRVLVTTKDGRRIRGKFVERKGSYVVLDNEQLRAGDIRAFVIDRSEHRMPNAEHDTRQQQTNKKG